MKYRLLLVIALVMTGAPAVVHAVPGGSGGSGPPLIPGARQVQIRNGSGGLGVYTSIPGGSLFARHGGGPGAECDGVAAGDDPDTLDVLEDQRPIGSTKWIFIEGAFLPVELPVDLTSFDPRAGTPLDQVVRWFSVYSADTYFTQNALGLVGVSATDPMIDPRTQLTNLYNGLQLEVLSVYENPVVDRWGGLVVRNPAWLAVNGSAWRTQRSNVVSWRGWQLSLVAQPTELEFELEFIPDADRPSEPFSGVVGCVSSSDGYPVSNLVEFPQRPSDLADFAEPGSNRACEWTPPGPGEVTVTARQRCTVTLWASGSVEAEPDYVWSSDPVTFRVGELVAVNVNE